MGVWSYSTTESAKMFRDGILHVGELQTKGALRGFVENADAVLSGPTDDNQLSLNVIVHDDTAV